MNPSELPNDSHNNDSSVFIVTQDEFGLYYIPGSQEIVSRHEPVRSPDRTPSCRGEALED